MRPKTPALIHTRLTCHDVHVTLKMARGGSFPLSPSVDETRTIRMYRKLSSRFGALQRRFVIRAGLAFTIGLMFVELSFRSSNPRNAISYGIKQLLLDHITPPVAPITNASQNIYQALLGAYKSSSTALALRLARRNAGAGVRMQLVSLPHGSNAGW